MGSRAVNGSTNDGAYGFVCSIESPFACFVETRDEGPSIRIIEVVHCQVVSAMVEWNDGKVIDRKVECGASAIGVDSKVADAVRQIGRPWCGLGSVVFVIV